MKQKIKELIEACISSGKFVRLKNGINVSQEDILEIEDILNRLNDKAARTKIRKVIS